LKTKIQKNYVLAAGQEAITSLYDSGYFGRPKDDSLYLRFVEAAYLLFKNKITIEQNKKELNFDAFMEFASLQEDFFELKYIVYKDLKERGYYVQSSAVDFRVYPRGGHPGKTAAKSFVFVRSERMPISFSEIIAQINNAQNVRKQFVLAVVDEESDITYYDVKRADAYAKFEGEMAESFQDILEEVPFKAVLYKERVILSGKNMSSVLHDNAFFGKIMDEERILLSFVEALYLFERGILKLYDMEEKELTREAFISQASHVDPEFMKKYIIYKELKERGFVPKTGFKFGTHFRLYQKTQAGKIPHSEFLLHVISPDFEFKLPATSGAIRLANSVRKRMIYAADIGSKREYIEFERIKM
jgi:tRNA-intron endonuclease